MAEAKDLIECLKKKAMEAMETYTKKDAWKQEDLIGAKDAMKLYNEACDGLMKDGIWQEMKGDWGTSNGMNSGCYGPQYGRYMPYSYGEGNMNSGWNMPHGTTRISYGNDNDMNSGARGRDAMTGQYISRNAMYHDPRYSDSYGYDHTSGHSVKDRMIAALEQQMDAVKTEYEREEVRKAIAEIERMKR